MAGAPAEERGRGAGSRGAQVYEALLDRIRSGELLPGMRLREEELARLLDVSRTPVREALTRLQARGLVDSAAGGLAVVQVDRRQVMELYAMRASLEGAAAAFAAENASAAEITGMRLLTARFAERSASPAEAARANAELHEAIYEAAHNRYLRRMLTDLNDSLALLSDTTFSVEGRAAAARREHGAIVAAIEARDASKAETAARRHIERALGARLEMIFTARGGM